MNVAPLRDGPLTAADLEADGAARVAKALYEFVVQSIIPEWTPKDFPEKDEGPAPNISQGVPAAWLLREVPPLLGAFKPERPASWENKSPVEWMTKAAGELESLETSVSVTESARRVGVTAMRLAIARENADASAREKAREEAIERLEAVLELEVGPHPTRQCPLVVRQCAELLLLREGALSGAKLSEARARLDTEPFFLISRIAAGIHAYERATTPEGRRAAAAAAADELCAGFSRADLVPHASERTRWVTEGLELLGMKIEADDAPLSVVGVQLAGYRKARAGPDGERRMRQTSWDAVLNDPGFAALPQGLRFEFTTRAMTGAFNDRAGRDARIAQARERISQRPAAKAPEEQPEEFIPAATRLMLLNRLSDSIGYAQRSTHSSEFGAIEGFLVQELYAAAQPLTGERAELVRSVIEKWGAIEPEERSKAVHVLRVMAALRMQTPDGKAWAASLDQLRTPEATNRILSDGRSRLEEPLRLAVDRALREADGSSDVGGLVDRARLLIQSVSVLSPTDLDLNVDAHRALASAAMRASPARPGWSKEFDGLIEGVKARAANTPWVEPADAEALERARWASRLRQAGRADDARKTAMEVTAAKSEPGKPIVGRAAFWLAWAEVLESVSPPAPGGGSEGEVRIRLRALAAIDPAFGRLSEAEKVSLQGRHGEREFTADESDAFAALNQAADRLEKLSQRVEKAK
ncbi:MAG: hypothetical protein K2X32_11890 [Phycisphaerales bacterium]|nr:hypothetical protein [Phycisphaerales bacterium]